MERDKQDREEKGTQTARYIQKDRQTDRQRGS